MNIRKEFKKTRHLLYLNRSPHQTTSPVLSVQGLTISYATGAALQDISFSVNACERLAVVGPNGAGKSTLFKAIAGVIRITEGEVRVYGTEPDGHICIGYVPQRSQVDWRFPVSVADVVMMGRVGRQGFFRSPQERDHEMVRHALELVHMQDLADRQIAQLSSGQQQRMFIARAVAQEAALMLMDEPLTGLDVNSQEDIFAITETLSSKGVTILVALHDLQLAAEKFDRVLLLNRHLIGIGPAEEVLTAPNLISAYQGRLRVLPTENGYLALGDTCCDDQEHAHD